MNVDDLQRFADDLRDIAGLDAVFEADPKPDSLHVLTINGVDFFFCTNTGGYDGWGGSLREQSEEAKARIESRITRRLGEADESTG